MAELRIVSSVEAPDLLRHFREVDRNFEPRELEVAQPELIWRVDHYRREIGVEAPGDPLPNGPWAIACDLSRSYAFVDPSIVRAFFEPSEPLENRTLLLEVHFWGLRIYVGVRVGVVYDETRGEGAARQRVRGWCYDTLEGHFEQGRICYEVAKRLDTGQVEFRIDALSRRADPGNLLIAGGFVLFGRRKQTQFARNGLERMAGLTRARLGETTRSGASPP